MPPGTVEDDHGVCNRWLQGKTGRGRDLFYRSDPEPRHRHADFIRRELDSMNNLDSCTRRMVAVTKPAEAYVSVLEGGALAILKYNDEPARVCIPGGGVIALKPYDIVLVQQGILAQEPGRRRRLR